MKNELSRLEEFLDPAVMVEQLNQINATRNASYDPGIVMKGHMNFKVHFGCLKLFGDEVKRTKQAINEATLGMTEDEEIKVYIKQVDSLLEVIIDKNTTFLKVKSRSKNQERTDFDEYQSALGIRLIDLRMQLDSEYARFLHDPKNATIESFEDSLLSMLSREHSNIYEKGHKPDCDVVLKAKEDADKYILDHLADIKNRYSLFAKNWLDQQAELGHKREEIDFINLLLKKRLFRTYKKEGYVIAKSLSQNKTVKEFKFKIDFYKNYFTRYLKLQNEFLRHHLKEIKQDSTIAIEQSEKIRTKFTVSQIGFLFRVFKAAEVMDFPTETAASDFAEKYFSSIKSPNIQSGQTRKRSYEITNDEYDELSRLFTKMRDETMSKVKHTVSKSKKKRR